MASSTVQPQKIILQNDSTSCTTLGIQYAHTTFKSGSPVGMMGFAIEMSGRMIIFKFPMTIAAKIIAAPLLLSPPYICPSPGTNSDNIPAMIGLRFIILPLRIFLCAPP